MKIKTKLILAFLAVGILPMLAAVYLSLSINENFLEEEGRQRLDNALKILNSRQEQLFSRTAVISKLLAEDKVIVTNLYSLNRTVVLKRMNEFLKNLPTDQKVNDMEYLPPDKMLLYVKDTSKINVLHNPVWQGYTITTTQNGLTGIMVTSVSKIYYKNRFMGGYKVGIWTKEGMIDAIPTVAPGVVAVMLKPDFKDYPNDPQSQALKKTVFEKGQFFSSENLLYQDISLQIHCQPIKDPKGDIIGAILLGSPKSTVSEVWSQYKTRFYGLMIAVSSILAFILAFLIARTISSPVRELVKGVREISNGNLDYRIRIRSRDEMKDLAHAYNDMASHLKEIRELEHQMHQQDKLASLGKLSAGIAHEIRNPLGSIKSYAGILRDKFLKNAKERELIQIIIEEVNRLNNFIQEFLDFAKPKEPRILPMDPDTMIHRIIQLAQTQYPRDKYVIEHLDTNPFGLIAADPDQMQQVFLNLILNSCQALPEGGVIRIKYLEPNAKGQLGIQLSDNGIGISEENQKKIFDPFFTTRNDGTGLGLSVVSQIIQNHKGHIELTSKEGEGTQITLWLPLAKIDKEDNF